MLKYKITNQNTVADLTNISYNLLDASGEQYLFETVPFNVNYGLKNGEYVIFQGYQNDGTVYVEKKEIFIDSGMTANQFKVNKFNDIQLNLFKIIEKRYENAPSDIIFKFNQNCYLYPNDEIYLKMDASFTMFGVDNRNEIVITMTVVESTNDTVIVSFENDYEGIPKDIIINYLINPNNLPYFFVFKHNNNFFRKDVKPNILKYKADYVVPIQINDNFSTNTFQTEEVTTKFVEVETEKALNRIVNMEKDAYVPAYIPLSNTIDDAQLRGQNLPLIEEIEINLHFRERDMSPANKDKWLVKQFGYWNGYKLAGTKLVPSDTGNWSNSKIVTFNDPASQSDLLGYLNFTNNDVRYQKSKLKKSFIRLLFYDSKDTANQKLLYYSTIFIDSGKLFGKYAKYSEGDTEYWVANADGSSTSLVKGITVNGEFSGNGNDNYKENYRLDSRITIKDQYNNKASSEGFYLYLFSENNPKLRAKDIYMRVEFNHAGYGITTPFMLPMKENHNGTYTYRSPIDIKDQDFPYNGYSLHEYYENLYIHFKYVYDNVNNRYVYYLPQPLESTTSNGDLMKMVLNLYEVKIG